MKLNVSRETRPDCRYFVLIFLARTFYDVTRSNSLFICINSKNRGLTCLYLFGITYNGRKKMENELLGHFLPFNFIVKN